jgi:hypothetical protein
VRLLFRDQPLEGALVVALPKDAPEKKLEARTDSSGPRRARARRGAHLAREGRSTWWRLPAGSGADWESLWASLTFEIPAR